MKKSGYTPLYFNGNNTEAAELIGNFLTFNHSNKIKAGNNLEKDISHDIKEHSEYSFYKGIYITEPEINKPCVISSCKFSKVDYEKYGLVCKNKKCIEADFVILTNTSVHIVELKNGCNFDTKKSKGEVQSLEATKKLCEFMGYTQVKCYICCFDAKVKSDIILKTDMGNVETIVYNQLTELWGINGDESRNRINAIHRQRATENLKKLDEFVTAYMSIKNKNQN